MRENCFVWPGFSTVRTILDWSGTHIGFVLFGFLSSGCEQRQLLDIGSSKLVDHRTSSYLGELSNSPYDTRALLPQISAERVRQNKRRRNVKPYQPHFMANKHPSLQPKPGAMSCFRATTPDLDSPPSIGFSRRPLFQTRPRTPDVEDDLDDAALERILCAQAAPTAVFRATLRLNAHRLARCT